MTIRTKKEYQVGDEIEIEGIMYDIEKVEEEKSHFIITTSDVDESERGRLLEIPEIEDEVIW